MWFRVWEVLCEAQCQFKLFLHPVLQQWLPHLEMRVKTGNVEPRDMDQTDVLTKELSLNPCSSGFRAGQPLCVSCSQRCFIITAIPREETPNCSASLTRTLCHQVSQSSDMFGTCSKLSRRTCYNPLDIPEAISNLQ